LNAKEIEEIKSAVSSAIETELGQYKVPKEQHYQDHLWILEIRDWAETIQNSAIKAVVTTVVGGLMLLLILGFIFWGKQNIGQ